MGSLSKDRRPLILASASPRRRELLVQAGLDFEVRTSAAEEDATDHPADPAAYAERLARIKAEDVALGVDQGVIIGADTVVVLDGEIINKPTDDADALRMLTALQGRAHQVITGVAVLDVRDGTVVRRLVRSVSTEVRMRAAGEAELAAYVATGEPRDKAGAYGIQGRAAVFIEGITGDYFNVVGLPLFTLCRMLERIGVYALPRA
jgi:septum formation protein